MNFQQAIHKLTTDINFKHWHKEHAEKFLSHGFLMLDEANKDTWQIGFYDGANKRMTTFLVSEKGIEQTQEQEILETDLPPQKLSPSELIIEESKALDISKETLKKYYDKESSIKNFFIIQQTPDGPIYNITYFTQSFKTINIKISAKTGQILSHNLQALADFA